MDITIPTRVVITCDNCTDEKRALGGLNKYATVTFETLSLAVMHIMQTAAKNEGVPHTLTISLED